MTTHTEARLFFLIRLFLCLLFVWFLSFRAATLIATPFWMLVSMGALVLILLRRIRGMRYLSDNFSSLIVFCLIFIPIVATGTSPLLQGHVINSLLALFLLNEGITFAKWLRNRSIAKSQAK